MTYRVVFTPEAEEQLSAVYRYLATEASPAIAYRYTHDIIEHCEGFNEFPYRAVRRDDIRQGLRLTHFKGRVVIAFALDTDQVVIVGVFYGGQNYVNQLQPPVD